MAGELAERGRAGTGQAQCQLGHGVGHRHGVDGHVVEVDHRGRPLGGGPHEGRGHLVRGDALQQVGGLDDEVGVEPGGAGHRAGGLLDQQGEPVGGGRVGLALEQSGQQQVPLLPADQLLVGLDVAAAGQEAPRLELDQHGRHDQELGQDLQVHGLPRGHLGHEGVDDVGQRDVEDVHLVAVHQLQQDVDRALEDGRGDGGGSRSRRYRVRRAPPCTGHRAPLADAPTPGTPWPGRTMSPSWHVCSPESSPAATSTSATTWGRSATGWTDQDSHDAFYCVVDLHALTLDIDPADLRARTHDTALDLLAAGLDPERCTLFVQSHVVQHAQMAWLLECTATMGELRADDPVQGQERGQGVGPGRPVHLPGADGGRHRPLRRRAGAGGRRPAPAPRAGPGRSPSASTTASATPWWCPRRPSRPRGPG